MLKGEYHMVDMNSRVFVEEILATKPQENKKYNSRKPLLVPNNIQSIDINTYHHEVIPNRITSWLKKDKNSYNKYQTELKDNRIHVIITKQRENKTSIREYYKPIPHDYDDLEYLIAVHCIDNGINYKEILS